ncbi:MAG: DUF749 family protein [Candidatus Eisenbacteria bacterium]
MYNDNYTFTADLLAFVEWQDLPPALYPFVRSASLRDHVMLGRKSRVLVLRIREAPEACHAIIVDKGMTMNKIEARIRRELEVVTLSEETRDALEDLLEKNQRGDLTYFISNVPSRV